MKPFDGIKLLTGMSAAASLIGLALLGLCFGASMRSDAPIAMTEHALFLPGLICVAAVALPLVLLPALVHRAL